MPAWFWYLFILLAVAAILLIQWLLRENRRKALTIVANRLGLTFEVTDWGPRSSGPQLESRHFSNSYNQSFRNSMSGERAGFYASFFDHVIIGRTGHTDTMASFTQGIWLPEFALAQRDMFSKIGNIILHQTIDFSSDSAFSERFQLVAADKERVRELFAPDMRAFLSGIQPEWRIEGFGHTLVIYKEGYVVKPDEFADFVDETTEIAKKFFSYCHLKESASWKRPRLRPE